MFVARYQVYSYLSLITVGTVYHNMGKGKRTKRSRISQLKPSYRCNFCHLKSTRRYWSVKINMAAFLTDFFLISNITSNAAPNNNKKPYRSLFKRYFVELTFFLWFSFTLNSNKKKNNSYICFRQTKSTSYKSFHLSFFFKPKCVAENHKYSLIKYIRRTPREWCPWKSVSSSSDSSPIYKSNRIVCDHKRIKESGNDDKRSLVSNVTRRHKIIHYHHVSSAGTPRYILF